MDIIPNWIWSAIGAVVLTWFMRHWDKKFQRIHRDLANLRASLGLPQMEWQSWDSPFSEEDKAHLSSDKVHVEGA